MTIELTTLPQNAPLTGNEVLVGATAANGTMRLINAAALAAFSQSPQFAGIDGTGATDVTAAIQAILSAGGSIIADPSKVYGITAPLTFGAHNAKLCNLQLVVLGGTWAPGQYALTIGEDTGASTKYANMHVNAVHVDAAHIAWGGIHCIGMEGGSVRNCDADRATGAQMWNGGTLDQHSCTDTVFDNNSGTEWYWGEGGGETNLALRTSDGLVITSSDCNVTGGSFSRCLRSFDVDDCWNVRISNVTFFAGQTRTNPASVVGEIGPNANRVDLVNNRFDDGAVVVKNFNNRFDGNRFIQFNAAADLRLVATTANEAMDDFVFINNVMNTAAAELATEGAGSWWPMRTPMVANNQTGAGGPYNLGGIFDTSTDLLLQRTAETGNFTLTLPMSGKAVPFTPGGTITLPASFDGFHCVLDSTGTGTATFSGATILGDASVECVNGTQIAIRRRGTSAGAQWIIKGIQP